MKSIRLLPIVILATFALLMLKSVGLITNGEYVLVGTNSVNAQENLTQDETGKNLPQFSASDNQAAERASENLFSRANEAPINSTSLDAVPVTKNNNGDKIAIGSIDGVNNTERAILERLGERRTELELFSSELDVRLALVEAAENRLALRIANLEEIEARIDLKVKEKKSLDDAQFKGLVGMYETMKPGDAAAIFNDLPMNVLLRVASSMSSRKMAPVLAKMSKTRASELTQRLAEIEVEPTMQAPLDDVANLPQIIGN